MILLKNTANNLRYLSFAIAISASFIATDTFAWSRQGHYELGNTTFNALSDSSKVYMRLRLHAMNTTGAKLKNMGDLSVMADELKDLPLEDVFKKFGEGVPLIFESEQKENTKHWHYQDAILNDKKAKCNIDSKGALIIKLNQFKEILMDRNNRLSIVQEGILWAFTLHLIEDIHQPLHNMSKVNGECESDLGGNKVCVKEENKQCELNLHQYWDRGFGVFDSPLTPTEIQSFQFSPESWAQEGIDQAEFVYGKRKEDYELTAATIVKSRAELASARSAKFIETIVRFKKGESPSAATPANTKPAHSVKVEPTSDENTSMVERNSEPRQ